ncbi:L,D-transpeptidase [Saccharopolyspora cebuensis]|uniref:L,D-transpeptidase family protein n=1 Tax=Saccharopolyspora cebuensis TaxID=418759 RepID=UPI0031E6EADF
MSSAARRIGIAALGVALGALAGCGPAPAPPPMAMMAPAVAGHPAATTFTELPGAPQDPDPGAETDGVVLRVAEDLTVHDAPAGEVFSTLPATQLDNPTWVPVIDQRGDWAQVMLPSRPNGSVGWIRASGLQAARSPYVVDVDVDARRMVVRRDGAPIGEWVVGVGGPASPTPRGRTYIMASIEETVTTFSPIILPLGTHSETFNSYGGGPGTVALHGWPDPAVFGQDSSDGCVRVPADAMELLTTLPLGTVVLLR